MALNTIYGSAVLVKIGDGADSETFTQPTLINTDRGIKFTCETNDISVPDPDNPDDPAWTELFKKAISVEVTGKGILDAVDGTMDTYTTWAGSQDAKNVQIWLSSGIGYWSGAFKLTDFEVSGTWGDDAEVNLTLKNHGEVTWNSASTGS